jgi:hypothetical protein
VSDATSKTKINPSSGMDSDSQPAAAIWRKAFADAKSEPGSKASANVKSDRPQLPTPNPRARTKSTPGPSAGAIPSHRTHRISANPARAIPTPISRFWVLNQANQSRSKKKSKPPAKPTKPSHTPAVWPFQTGKVTVGTVKDDVNHLAQWLESFKEETLEQFERMGDRLTSVESRMAKQDKQQKTGFAAAMHEFKQHFAEQKAAAEKLSAQLAPQFAEQSRQVAEQFAEQSHQVAAQFAEQKTASDKLSVQLAKTTAQLAEQTARQQAAIEKLSNALTNHVAGASADGITTTRDGLTATEHGLEAAQQGIAAAAHGVTTD